MLKKYLIVGRKFHEFLRKENTLFHAHLILSEENIASCVGFNIVETGKDDFELLNIIFKPEESISFNKNHNNRTEVLFFDLKFDQKANIYSGSWESDIIADKKKGSSFLLIFEIDKNIDLYSKLSNLS